MLNAFICVKFGNIMAKDDEKRIARIMYVEQGKTAKDIAALKLATEKTIGKWVDEGNWKDLRTDYLNSPNRRAKDIKDLIGSLTKRRLSNEAKLNLLNENSDANEEEITELHRSNISIADEVSKWNKTLENLDKENKISLGVHLNVMEEIFQHLQSHDPQLYLQTVEFQEIYIRQLANRY